VGDFRMSTAVSPYAVNIETGFETDLLQIDPVRAMIGPRWQIKNSSMNKRLTGQSSGNTRRLLLAYYIGTAGFLVLDYVFDINIRLTFLEYQPAWRFAYYLFCFACLSLMLWRPEWTVIVAAGESLVTLVLLILSFGSRVMLPGLPEDGAISDGPTLPAVMNFLISGTAAYIAWWRGLRDVQRCMRNV
jgi:hypothetical protein